MLLENGMHYTIKVGELAQIGKCHYYPIEILDPTPGVGMGVAKVNGQSQ
jgi:hypothetical protein